MQQLQYWQKSCIQYRYALQQHIIFNNNNNNYYNINNNNDFINCRVVILTFIGAAIITSVVVSKK